MYPLTWISFVYVSLVPHMNLVWSISRSSPTHHRYLLTHEPPIHLSLSAILHLFGLVSRERLCQHVTNTLSHEYALCLCLFFTHVSFSHIGLFWYISRLSPPHHKYPFTLHLSFLCFFLQISSSLDIFLERDCTNMSQVPSHMNRSCYRSLFPHTGLFFHTQVSFDVFLAWGRHIAGVLPHVNHSFVCFFLPTYVSFDIFPEKNVSTHHTYTLTSEPLFSVSLSPHTSLICFPTHMSFLTLCREKLYFFVQEFLSMHIFSQIHVSFDSFSERDCADIPQISSHMRTSHINWSRLCVSFLTYRSLLTHFYSESVFSAKTLSLLTQCQREIVSTYHRYVLISVGVLYVSLSKHSSLLTRF